MPTLSDPSSRALWRRFRLRFCRVPADRRIGTARAALAREVDFRVDVGPEPGRTAVRISGRLTADAVRELERICRDCTGAVVLDVTHLVSADDVGLATLRRLAADGIRLLGVSPYLALLLEDDRPREDRLRGRFGP